MSLVCATHSGPFHADDVLAWALLQTYHCPNASLIRTRDADTLDRADVVFDVGGDFDPIKGRFDHHQSTYQGDLSSAGMVLNWLESEGKVGPAVAAALRSQVVDYVDAVDNGRLVPGKNTPCFTKIVEAYTQGPSTLEEYDAAFHRAAEFAAGYVQGIDSGVRQIQAAEAAVVSAMDAAVADGVRVMFLDQYVKWKPVYYRNGGAEHPTDYIVFPSMEGTWRVVAVAPKENSFDQKRPLPEPWAGLTGDALTAVTGVPGSVFCHKNRFIAVFETRDGLMAALESHGLMRAETSGS